MSDAQNASSAATQQVVKYLEDHKVTDNLNSIVNDMCKAHPDDPYGYLVHALRDLAKPPTITRLHGREVIDSRGNPTTECDVYVNYLGEEKLAGRSAAPSGASTGSTEAVELRDDEKNRYRGKGVKTAVKNISTTLSKAVAGMDITQLRAIDEVLSKTDGDRLKKNLGGNAITASSFAIAEASANITETPLFLRFANEFHDEVPQQFSIPRCWFNVLNGGKHAGGELQVQEFMFVPRGNQPFREALRSAVECYHALGKILVAKYGKSAKNLGDEGGFAPALKDPEEALALLEEAIAAAGYKCGEDIDLAMDAASSEFYADGKYELQPGKFLTADEMIEFWVDLKKKHPALICIEDGLAEDDYQGWIKLTARFEEEFKGSVDLVGDDLLTTNTDRIKDAIAEKWCNALLLKVNQIGTISEGMDAAKMLYGIKGAVAVSHRSGEVPYSVIADLAVGIGSQYIKTGAPARGERVIKYNRLLQIEEYLEEHNMVKPYDA
jgi:enolase 1/2/3